MQNLSQPFKYFLVAVVFSAASYMYGYNEAYTEATDVAITEFKKGLSNLTKYAFGLGKSSGLRTCGRSI